MQVNARHSDTHASFTLNGRFIDIVVEGDNQVVAYETIADGLAGVPLATAASESAVLQKVEAILRSR